MALFDSGTPVANVALSDTFNTWRIRTNQINTQAAGLASNNTFTGTLNTFNNAVAVKGPVTAPIVTANSLAGTIATAAQPNITSVGTLTSLSVTNAAGFNGPVTAPVVTANTVAGVIGAFTGPVTAPVVTANTVAGVIGAFTGPVTAPVVTANSFVGPLTGVASIATTITLVSANTTDAVHFPVFVAAATGDENIRTDTGFTYNPSSGILSSTDFNSTSDALLKENITPVENALALINNLNGYTFDWKDQNRSSIGVTAQDVEMYLPQLVTRINDHKTVNYNGLIGVLIEAVKELSKKIESK
jgi:hypothetical protein